MKEIHISKHNGTEHANLVIDGHNCACITGNIRIAIDAKKKTVSGVFAWENGGIVGQYHNVDDSYTIIDVRHK